MSGPLKRGRWKKRYIGLVVFLFPAVIVGIFALVVFLLTEPPPALNRPNVLFVICDDLGARIGPSGYAGVHTPVLDQLVSDAMTFRRAYCQYSGTGPSRTSFLSGLYPESTKVLDNKADISLTRPGTPSLPEVFRGAGYWTAATGKVFRDPLENPKGETWDVVVGFDDQEVPDLERARKEFEEQHGSIIDKRNLKDWQAYCKTIVPQTRNQGGMGSGPTDLLDEQHRDGKNAETVATWLSTKAYGDKPFLIACGFHKPHIPFIAPARYFDLYSKRAIELSPDPVNDWDDIPALAYVKYHKDFGFPIVGEENFEKRRRLTRAYYACISFVDAQLGVILDALKKSGEWDNTIIIFIGDTGHLLGEHFMWGREMLFEEGVKVPMIVRVPGVTAGDMNTGLVELVDLFPSLAELCSVVPPGNLQGKSFVPMLKDPAAPGKEYAYTVVSRGDTLGAAVRYENYRYTEWGSPGENELYNLAKDPHERTNLARKPEYGPIIKQAKEILEKARAKAGAEKTTK